MDTLRPLVLVADDNPDILALVRFRLEQDGYEVLSAPDGETALDLALARAPTAAIPIILLTARVQEPDVSQGFEAGADDYVTKPFSPQVLGERIQAPRGACQAPWFIFRPGPSGR